MTEQLVSLTEQVKAHLQEYTENRHQHALEQSVFEILSPPWLTGFKPSIVFQLLQQSVDGLSTEQKSELRSIQQLTSHQEKLVANEMAFIQESMASPRLAPMLRNLARGMVMVGDDVDMVEALLHLKSRLLKDADNLRGHTWKGVMDILNLPPRVMLLTAGIQFHIKSRNWGIQMQSQPQD